MTRFEDDITRLTFDDAEILVDRYIREHENRTSRVTSKHVARSYGVEVSQHNLLRLNSALKKQLEPVDDAGNNQFKL